MRKDYCERKMVFPSPLFPGTRPVRFEANDPVLTLRMGVEYIAQPTRERRSLPTDGCTRGLCGPACRHVEVCTEHNRSRRDRTVAHLVDGVAN
jgi:hypothetical protein